MWPNKQSSLTLFLGVVLVVVLMVSGCSQSDSSTGSGCLRAGALFPALTLTAIDGEAVAIDQLRGRLIVLNVWATWCAPCRKELPSLERLSQALDVDQFVVMGLSVDHDDHLAREYLIDMGVTYANYIDKDMSLSRRILGLAVFPGTYIISPKGALLKRVIGERVWDNDEMVKALEQAYQGYYELLEDI